MRITDRIDQNTQYCVISKQCDRENVIKIGIFQTCLDYTILANFMNYKLQFEIYNLQDIMYKL